MMVMMQVMMEAKMSAAKEEADEKRKKLIEEGKLVEGSEEDVKMLEEASKAQGTLAKTASAEMQLGQTETISVNGEQVNQNFTKSRNFPPK